MKHIKKLLILAVTFLAFSSIADVNAQSFPTQNTKIDQDVFRQLIKMPYYGVFDHISFETGSDGTVTLRGKILNASLKKTAERNVEKVAGVKRVINDIEILPPSPYDDRIRDAALRTLANEGGSLYRYLIGTRPSMRIIVNRGRISLEGFVGSQSDADLANILVNQIAGTFSVSNNLQVSRSGSN